MYFAGSIPAAVTASFFLVAAVAGAASPSSHAREAPPPAATAVLQAAPTDDEAAMPLRAVVRRQTDVFASTEADLFRADRAQQQWHKLTPPDDMPPGGSFAGIPDDSDLLLYYASHRNTRLADREPYRFGIYLSRDDGETWELISEHDDYGPVLLLPNGSLFAVINAMQLRAQPILHLSEDMGRTWRDVSEGIFGQVTSIFPDPDHPDRVCLSVNSIRNYILQAEVEDEHYRWWGTRIWDWKPERFAFARSYSGSPLYMLDASLSNYFDCDFDNRIQLPAYDLSPDDPRFTFQPGEAVVVPVTVRFRENMDVRRHHWRQGAPGKPEPQPRTVHLIDHPEAIELWSLEIEREGQRHHIARPAEGMDRQELRNLRDWQTIPVTETAPCRRSVALHELYDFSAPGHYHVQLKYANGSLAADELGEWISFTSPVFEIVIAHPED